MNKQSRSSVFFFSHFWNTLAYCVLFGITPIKLQQLPVAGWLLQKEKQIATKKTTKALSTDKIKNWQIWVQSQNEMCCLCFKPKTASQVQIFGEWEQMYTSESQMFYENNKKKCQTLTKSQQDRVKLLF